MGVAAINSDGELHGRSLVVFAVTTATIALATILVVILAWLLAFFLSFIVDFGVFHGLGRSEDDITDHHMSILHKCDYVFSVLYNPALMATKSSILVLYLRVTKNTRLLLRHASWVILGIVNIAGFILTIINIFQCRPVRAGWMLELYNSSASCIPLLIEFICASPVNIITDLAILILPIPVLTSMRLPMRQKVILILAFALGAFVSVIGVVRIYYLGQALISPDASFSLMWSAVEVNIGITCASIPTIKPLILKLFPNILHEPNSTRTSSGAPIESQEPLYQTTKCKPTESDKKSTGTTTESPSTPDTVHFGNDFQDLDSTPATSAAAGRTNPTSSTTGTMKSGTSFGFVKTNEPKGMVRANAAESFKYCAIVSLLFFLSGMSYGLLDNVNIAVATVNNISTAQNIGLTTVYSGIGYFFGPLLAGEFLLQDRHFFKSRAYEADNISGYKKTFIVGLCVYGIGTISFWPSAVTSSYAGFMISNFFIGFGLAVIEVGSNSFMVLCGPPNYAETRILIAQAIQGAGSITNSLLAQKVFLKGIDTSGKAALVNVQWVYLGITLFCAILGLFFFYVPLPDVSDDELKELPTRLQVDPKKKVVGGLQLRTVSLILAVFTQYMFAAAQGSNFAFYDKLFKAAVPKDAIGVGEPADPDKLSGMTLSMSDCILFVLPLILMLAAETPISPLVFAFGLRGQGRRTTRAVALITMGESGPAVVPFIMYGIMNAGGAVQTAYIVLIAVLAAAMVYPAFLVLSGPARKLFEPYSDVQSTIHMSQEDQTSIQQGDEKNQD
ncbi:major facilitator superfamily protein [Hirsutella rhossiliensis]|uniref:Major facilitator superfamily domain-containing protein n=1 Tax=Hirsutella rhossiliensis TaxID=111463 RepID=A0A9P8SMB6_9HYPO|nr:major facilitator superfamily domain-containing protein [Hirsutella rhossiliensis]KAH0965991.1 major facilitator superfamily domain-containing protein [Hirsutella rhossiliensis]